jgi:hypothetical protein
MAKRNFIVFVLLSLVVVVIGIYYVTFDKQIYIPGYISDSRGEGSFSGWTIIICGVVMLLFGFLIKWIANKEKIE